MHHFAVEAIPPPEPFQRKGVQGKGRAVMRYWWAKDKRGAEAENQKHFPEDEIIRAVRTDAALHPGLSRQYPGRSKRRQKKKADLRKAVLERMREEELRRQKEGKRQMERWVARRMRRPRKKKNLP